MSNDPADRRWIATFSGRRFWPLEPRVEDVSLVDIAHALSNICRFTGHVKQFYSVAQHSVIASIVAPKHLARWALFHDATEAYLCDVASPVKHDESFANYRVAEQALEDVIVKRFMLVRPLTPRDCDVMSTIDRDLAESERALLLTPIDAPTHLSAQFIEHRWRFDPMTPVDAELAYLRRFAELWHG